MAEAPDVCLAEGPEPPPVRPPARCVRRPLPGAPAAEPSAEAPGVCFAEGLETLGARPPTRCGRRPRPAGASEAGQPPAADDGGGLDLARFDGLLAELRREHESVARRLRGRRPSGAAAGLRALAGRGDGAPDAPAPPAKNVWAPPGSWPLDEGSDHEEEEEPRAEVFAIRDPTESDEPGALAAEETMASTPSGGVRKAFGKSFTKSLNHPFKETSFSFSVSTALRSLHGRTTAGSRRVFREDGEPRRRSACQRFVSSPTFEFVWSSVIMLNTITMALEAQYDGMEGSYRHGLGRSPSTEPASEVWPGAETLFMVADRMFGALFTLELLWRASVRRKELFLDFWPWIDIIAVALFWLGMFITSLSDVHTFLRFVRLVKLMRFIRVFRFVHAFEKLYLIVSSIKSSFSALAWSSAVLLLIEMVFALTVNILLEGFWQSTSNPLDDRNAIYLRFGTFSKALLSMFEMLLGNWYSITNDLVKVSEWWMIFGVGHQLVFGFAVIEVMTGVFLHETFQVAAMDDGIITNETKRAVRKNSEKMHDFFRHADTDGDGFLDHEELGKVLERPRVQEWLAGMGLDIPDVTSAFRTMDKDGDGLLSVEEFVEGALKMKGQARAIDVAVLRCLLEELRIKVDQERPKEEARSLRISIMR